MENLACHSKTNVNLVREGGKQAAITAVLTLLPILIPKPFQNLEQGQVGFYVFILVLFVLFYLEAGGGVEEWREDKMEINESSSPGRKPIYSQIHLTKVQKTPRNFCSSLSLLSFISFSILFIIVISEKSQFHLRWPKSRDIHSFKSEDIHPLQGQ